MMKNDTTTKETILLDGMNLDSDMLIQVQNNTIAQQSVRIAQMEAAVQQLLAENQQLRETMYPADEEAVPLASTND